MREAKSRDICINIEIGARSDVPEALFRKRMKFENTSKSCITSYFERANIFFSALPTCLRRCCAKVSVTESNGRHNATQRNSLTFVPHVPDRSPRKKRRRAREKERRPVSGNRGERTDGGRLRQGEKKTDFCVPADGVLSPAGP